MRSSRQMSGIIPYVLSVLLFPLKCNSAVHTMQNRDEEHDSQLRHLLIPSRRLLYSWEDDYSRNKYTNHDSGFLDDGKKIYIIIIAVFVLIALLIKCCIKCAQKMDAEETNAVVHPPPVPPHSDRRPYHPPSSGVTLITPPSHYNFHDSYTGIENPGFNPSGNTSALSNSTIRLLNDMPPTYDTVIASDQRKSSGRQSGFPSVVANTLPPAPPKYGEKF